MTEQAKSIVEEIEMLKSEIEELESAICSYCDGNGEVIATERIHSQTIDIPYNVCGQCGGTGIK